MVCLVWHIELFSLVGAVQDIASYVLNPQDGLNFAAYFFWEGWAAMTYKFWTAEPQPGGHESLLKIKYSENSVVSDNTKFILWLLGYFQNILLFVTINFFFILYYFYCTHIVRVMIDQGRHSLWLRDFGGILTGKTSWYWLERENKEPSTSVVCNYVWELKNLCVD